ncbi:hypothetical protein Hanom_Chr01g00045391 [Helianthus anomalus]
MSLTESKLKLESRTEANSTHTTVSKALTATIITSSSVFNISHHLQQQSATINLQFYKK